MSYRGPLAIASACGYLSTVPSNTPSDGGLVDPRLHNPCLDRPQLRGLNRARTVVFTLDPRPTTVGAVRDVIQSASALAPGFGADTTMLCVLDTGATITREHLRCRVLSLSPMRGMSPASYLLRKKK